MLSTLVSLAQQTNRLLIDGLGIRSPGYLHDLLLLSKGDKLKDREELLEKKEDRKEEKEEKKKAKSGTLGAVGRGISGIGGLLKNTLIPLLGTMASVIGPILLPIMAVALAAGLGLMVGNYIYKTWVEGWIDDFHQGKEDEMNRVQTRAFKDTKFINEDGSEERAFKIPEGHADESTGAAAISETKARKHFKKNKGKFTSKTFEEAVESGELETLKYAVNKADPTKLMSGKRTVDKSSKKRAGIDQFGQGGMNEQEISDLHERTHAEFLHEVDNRLADAKSTSEMMDVLKSVSLGRYVGMIKRKSELTGEAKSRLLTGFVSSRLVEGSGYTTGKFDERVHSGRSPFKTGASAAIIEHAREGFGTYDFTRKSIAPISLSPTSAVDIVAAVEENNEAQASGKGNNPSTTVINNNPVTTSVKNDTHVNSMPTVNTDAALQMANRNDFGS